MAMQETAPSEILDALRRMALLQAGVTARGERLTGGVSSDIWRIDLPSGPICVKRALAKLRVAADWQAPVERNRYEARWMQHANAAVPGAAPTLLGLDEADGRARHAVPAARPTIRCGRRSCATAMPIRRSPPRSPIRSRASMPPPPRILPSRPTSRPIGSSTTSAWNPTWWRPAVRIPTSHRALHDLVATTQANRHALVHGDVSPKNILRGPDGPVFLDAECAWWGDPAFDLAFCLNHLLLKCLWTPSATAGFLACFDALAAAYLARVAWEAPHALEARAARLLPGLFLARVDGKSPVEYITAEQDKNRVRRTARALLANPVEPLGDVRLAWTKELAA